jgi:Tfp pilus assembly protein PilO
MQKNAEKLTLEIKALIARGNTSLNDAKNKQKATAYLYIIFSFVALSLFGVFAIGPTLATISDLNKQLEEKQVALQQLEEKNAALKSLGAQYISIQQDLRLIDGAIPQSPKVGELMRQLETLTLRNDLVVQKLDTGLMELYPAKNSNSPVFAYTFSISVLGAEQDINRFIGDVISMERIVGIDKLTTGKRFENVFTASLTGKAYFIKN